MNDVLLDAFRHNAWANKVLIEYCLKLSAEQLATQVPGSYGSILQTMQHVIGGEDFYLILLTGRDPAWLNFDETVPMLDRWERCAGDLARAWDALLAEPLDSERVVVENQHDGSGMEVRVGVLLAQALYHGNIHREQICGIISSLGLEPPNLEAWAYGTATGRHVTRPPGSEPQPA